MEDRSIGASAGRRVLVVGSANMDMVVSCRRFPRPGETIFATDFGMYPGGKGANQAAACARLGGRVSFVGKLGEDAFATELVTNLERAGASVEVLTGSSPTGVAVITVDDSGENEIVVASGSNMELTPADVEAREDLFTDAAVVLLQLEIPLPAVERAAELGRRHGATVILNPAPAMPLPPGLLESVDVITPNRIEAGQLAGFESDGVPSSAASAGALLERGVGAVVVTLGGEGALLVTPEGTHRFAATQVEPVDTTGAGDAFNGALACALAEGRDLHAAIQFANAAAAVSVTRRGAQAAMPTRQELGDLTTLPRN